MSSNKPFVYVSVPDGRPLHGKVWVRVGDEYVDISNLVSGVSFEGDVNGVVQAKLTFPYAATGEPPA